MSTNLEALFQNSYSYDNEHLLLLLDSLNQVTIEFLEKMSQEISPTKKNNCKKIFLFFHFSRLFFLFYF